jgi:hypothetical protein
MASQKFRYVTELTDRMDASALDQAQSAPGLLRTPNRAKPHRQAEIA